MKKIIKTVSLFTLINALVFLTCVNVFASDLPVKLSLSDDIAAAAGQEVSIYITAEINENTDIQGIQADICYSDNFPAIDERNTKIEKNTTGWEQADFIPSVLICFGDINKNRSEITGLLQFTVPKDAVAGTVYSIKINNAVAADANGEIGIEVIKNECLIRISGHGDAPGHSAGTAGSRISADSVPAKETASFPFVDVTESDWFYTAVKFSFEKGITSGISENTFAPNNVVTRGQFISMLCRAYGIAQREGDNFSDSGDTWYTGYLAAAKQLGISNGIGDNMFAPEREISREEMVTLIYNYLKSGGKITEETELTGFADEASVSAWAKAAVAFAAKNNIVKGKNNNIFAPQDTATRAELAQILYNTVKSSL